MSFTGDNSFWYEDPYTYADPRTWTLELWLNPTSAGTEVRVLEWLNGGSTDGRFSRAYWVVDLGAISFVGDIDDVRLWAVARTAADVATDRVTTYAAGAMPAGLVDQFDFDAGFDSLTGNTAGETWHVTRVE